jgi:hypothetical protein
VRIPNSLLLLSNYAIRVLLATSIPFFTLQPSAVGSCFSHLLGRGFSTICRSVPLYDPQGLIYSSHSTDDASRRDIEVHRLTTKIAVLLARGVEEASASASRALVGYRVFDLAERDSKVKVVPSKSIRGLIFHPYEVNCVA